MEAAIGLSDASFIREQKKKSTSQQDHAVACSFMRLEFVAILLCSMGYAQ